MYLFLQKMKISSIAARKLTCLFIVLLIVCGLKVYWQKLESINVVTTWLFNSGLKNPLRQLMSEVFFNPVFYLLTLGIFFLEYFIPAKKNQKIFSTGLMQDFIWLMGDFFVKSLLLIPYFLLLRWVYSKTLVDFSINLPIKLALPRFATFTLSFLLIDFLSWLSHLLLHKIKFLWRFHAVHHAQKQLNLFTDIRFHFGEAFIGYPLTILPMYFLAIPIPYGIYYLLIRTWYPRVYHANIKSSFGVFKYLLVTPQSHRIHHSLEPQHYDHNFGVIFSIWDYIFNTQYKNYKEYPDTGISDNYFPVEKQAKLTAALKNYCAQIVYPFGFRNRE